VHMLKSTDRCMCFEDSVILIADHGPIESTECGNKRKQKVENNLPVNTRISYSVTMPIASSMFLSCS
jgi:hypothetical protein